MKLSDDLRLGTMLRPQAFDNYFDRDGSCAVGAIAEARGVDPEDARLTAEINALTARHPCPECGVRHYSIIVQLNDEHKWTREQIADWLESIELASPVETPIAQDDEHEEQNLETWPSGC